MIEVRSFESLGGANHGWLDAKHHFSFADYHDPKRMGWGPIRVWNDDTIAPGTGFDPHPHNDMEIITVVLEGELEHKDSMGNQGTIRPGEVQRMSAGTGVRHSEFNHSTSEPVHLYQIWIEPEAQGITPSYEQKAYTVEERKNNLKQLAGRNPKNGAVKINQDAGLFTSILGAHESVEYVLPKGRYAWLQVARGGVSANGQRLNQGDGAAISEEDKLNITGDDKTGAEIFLFDLA